MLDRAALLPMADSFAYSKTIWLDRAKIWGDVMQRVPAPATSPALTRVMGILTIAGIESILIPEYEGDSYTKP